MAVVAGRMHKIIEFSQSLALKKMIHVQTEGSVMRIPVFVTASRQMVMSMVLRMDMASLAHEEIVGKMSYN